MIRTEIYLLVILLIAQLVIHPLDPLVELTSALLSKVVSFLLLITKSKRIILVNVYEYYFETPPPQSQKQF
jgi:hypothetical protein